MILHAECPPAEVQQLRRLPHAFQQAGIEDVPEDIRKHGSLRQGDPA
jgi:hypothetical protein